MKKIPIKSKIVSSIQFSSEDGKLRIFFRNGEERLFTDVPESIVEEMVTASSPGNYYIEHIRTNFRRLAT